MNLKLNVNTFTPVPTLYQIGGNQENREFHVAPHGVRLEPE